MIAVAAKGCSWISVLLWVFVYMEERALKPVLNVSGSQNSYLSGDESSARLWVKPRCDDVTRTLQTSTRAVLHDAASWSFSAIYPFPAHCEVRQKARKQLDMRRFRLMRSQLSHFQVVICLFLWCIVSPALAQVEYKGSSSQRFNIHHLKVVDNLK